MSVAASPALRRSALAAASAAATVAFAASTSAAEGSSTSSTSYRHEEGDATVQEKGWEGSSSWVTTKTSGARESSLAAAAGREGGALTTAAAAAALKKYRRPRSDDGSRRRFAPPDVLLGRAHPCRCDAAAMLGAGPSSSSSSSSSSPSPSPSSSVTVSVRDGQSGSGGPGSEPSSPASKNSGDGDGDGGKMSVGMPATQSGRLRLQRHRTLSLLSSSASNTSLSVRYDVHAIPLGEGAYGEVFLATDKRTGEQLALKKICKERTNKVEFQREMDALMYLRRHGGHPNICMLRENFDEPDHYVLILDLIRGGELFDHLIENGAYSEADAARLVREVASALDFCHAIGIVHADLKPENLMLSSRKGSAAAIKVVDFGCSEILPNCDVAANADLAELGYDDLVAQLDMGEVQARRMSPGRLGGSTPAYCPPESFHDEKGVPINPSVDMWSLGIIIYIMLTGVHPFDLDGTATDEQIEENIKTQRSPPLHGSPYTAHLSPSALDLLSKLFDLDPQKRLTAHEMLQHPWVLGRTASHDLMEKSAKRLSRFRKFKTHIERKVFEEFVNWSDDESRRNPSAKGTSLLERAFGKLDKTGKGVLRAQDLEEDGGEAASGAGIVGVNPNSVAPAEFDDDEHLCLSGFSDLLGENMKQKFFPRGHVVYHEGDHGDRMYFINSGSVHVSTKDGFTAKLGHGDTFGEGGILESHKRRSATIKCATPVHAIEIDEDCFRRYLSRSGSELALRIREKVNARRFGRAEQLISRQQSMRGVHVEQGKFVFEHGEESDAMYILEEGLVDVVAKNGSKVCSMRPGDMFGFQGFMINRTRKASAACVSPGGCMLKRMEAADFHKMLQVYPSLKETLRELGLRREFQRAIVLRTKRSFPTLSELREVFDEIDTEKTGSLNAEGIKELCSGLDKPLTDEEIEQLIRSLDLNNSGTVSFDEFKSIFGWQTKYN